MSTRLKNIKRVTTHTLLELKANGQKIAMLTAYDYLLAKLVDGAGIDVILVGDSVYSQGLISYSRWPMMTLTPS